MNIHLQIIGVFLMLLATIHVFFPKYFNWKLELESLSLINKQILKVHTFFIALTVSLMGILCFFHSTELIQTKLGRTICLGLGIFWGLRLVFQLFVYSPKLWKGKHFETTMHFLFTLLWLYISFIFFSIYIKN